MAAISDKKKMQDYGGISLWILVLAYWTRIFKLLSSPGIDSKESIQPAYVPPRAGTTTLFLLGS